MLNGWRIAGLPHELALIAEGGCFAAQAVKLKMLAARKDDAKTCRKHFYF